jgi:hypothetical protein
MMIILLSVEVQMTLPGINEDLAMPPISERLSTNTSTTWSHYLHAMPTTIDGRGSRNLS